MTNNLDELKKQIKPIPPALLKSMPDNEKNTFGKYKIFPIGILVKADWNYKENDEYMANKLLENIKRNGQIENCHVRLLDSGYYEIINGNHRYDGFIALGQNFVLAYDHGNISLAEAQRIAIETNETKFKANTEKLSEILNNLKLEFPDVELSLPYTPEELQDLLEISMPDLNEELSDIVEDDYSEEPPERPKTQRGDLYELNGHRLLCGDSTNDEDVARLMNGKVAHMLFTDPPYNINYADFNLSRSNGARNWTDEYCSEWHDLMPDDAYSQFLIDFLRLAKQNMIEFAHYYVWHATNYFTELVSAFKINEIPYDKVPIQWVKQVAPLSWVRYKRKNEPCIFGGKGAINGNGEGARWFGPNNEVTIWEIDRDHNGDYIHPTQKPVALAARAISNSSQKDELVIDMFLGSGTTLIASDSLGRLCNGMEYEPKFCDCIVKRYIKYCADNDKMCHVLLNGNPIDVNYFEGDE